MSRIVSRVSDSTGSTVSDRFFSARSSLEDEEMLETSGNHILPSSAPSNTTFEPSHISLHPENISLFPSSTGRQSVDPALTSNESESSSSLTLPDFDAALREELIAKGWIFPPEIPVSIIKYAIGRRELAMQTQIDQSFDLVNLEPYTSPPTHTPDTEKLKAWHKIVTRTPRCLPSRNDEPQWPQIKLSFGPLGWDQVWGYEFIDLKKVLHNAGYEDWWIRRSQDHLIWCCMHSHVEVYGAEVKFPYGYDTKLPAIDRTDIEKSIRIPANESVLVPLGKDVAEWARQVCFLYEHWDDGPLLPYSFNPYDRMQEPPTIVLRFRNMHPEVSTTTINSEDKGRWTKGWLPTEELMILSGEINTIYLDAVIDGGPRPDPAQTNAENRLRMLQFWDLEERREDMVEWLVGQRWMWERFRVSRRDVHGEEALRRFVREKIYESVARVIRDTPF